MAVNKRLAKKKAKMAVAKQATVEVKAVEIQKEEPVLEAVKVSLVVQAGEKEVTMEDAIERVKGAWLAEGNAAADLKELAVYVKPEDQAIYYVANGTITGKVAF